ncbi:hypothetical protein N7530_010601 [Penicillium desertorum]|uniref:Uncharacterized protein n=1 Tax=Penicillium desertorum TaxID=1303715 RepID=A0A9X0BHQ1_9EURO|nr:hypothetical protein N7530_010601 [Penicillium desertorum]
MAYLVKTISDPIRESIAQYNNDDDLSYTLTDTPDPLPPTVPLNNLKFKLVYNARDSSAV